MYNAYISIITLVTISIFGIKMDAPKPDFSKVLEIVVGLHTQIQAAKIAETQAVNCNEALYKTRQELVSAQRQLADVQLQLADVQRRIGIAQQKIVEQRKH